MEQVGNEMTAVARARDYGLDISLLRSSLALTPTERLIRNEDILALAEAFAQSRITKRASDPSPPAASSGPGR